MSPYNDLFALNISLGDLYGIGGSTFADLVTTAEKADAVFWIDQIFPNPADINHILVRSK